MKEPFDDEKYYTGEQAFGGICVSNFQKVLKEYNYTRYVNRFRQLADNGGLKRSQRPKLNKQEFDKLFDNLKLHYTEVGDRKFLRNKKTIKLSSRLLCESLFDEDIL